MRIEEYRLNLLLKKLSMEETIMIKIAFQKLYGVSIGLTPEELSEMKLQTLFPLLDIVRGLVLNKHHVPDIYGASDSLQSNTLSSKVSFGRQDKLANQE
ncbi:hypothetical protein [Paenibacillus donghaensis]|uniref:Uncharacterized protein n=1 Tax=Paenibacillus donghaensis TaxID=414771 RepID=A0A2Z2KE74_9BACL|nr:hypothetical protein [Paenibacillus donghaensis]ASA22175.1 hypothetical protein B9T62_16145 [Paenibacillus donghaensis]